MKYTYRGVYHDEGNCEIMYTYTYEKFLKRKFSEISVSDGYKARDGSPVLYLVLAFSANEIKGGRNKQYLFDSRCRKNTSSPFSVFNTDTYRVFVPFPAGAPDNIKRLKNSFLRLKELDSELKDLFLE